MRKVFTFFLLPVCLCLLVVAYSAEAQVHNEIGIYTDLSADPGAASILVEPYTLFDVYVLCVDPYNYNYRPTSTSEPLIKPIDLLLGFSWKLEFSDSGILMTQLQINGESGRFGNDPLNCEWAYADLLPVPENRIAHLATLTLMVVDETPRSISLGAHDLEFHHPGHMTVSDGDFSYGDRSSKAYPSSGSYDLPVFGINQSVVAVDRESWDSVKSLYR